MSKVAVNESILRWALDRSNQSVQGLRSRFPNIQQWLTGESEPTMKDLEKFALATSTPFGFMFLNAPPDLPAPIPHYRTASGKSVTRPSVDLLDTMYAIQSRQDWIRDLYIDEVAEPLAFVGSATLNEPAESVATRMRELLKFESGWASKCDTWQDALEVLGDAIDSAGVFVVINGIVANNTHRPLNPNEFRGFVMSDEYAPFVFVNGADAKSAQMFTLAHELAHVFYGKSASFDLGNLTPADDRVEQLCDSVAAEFLVPSGMFRSAWISFKNREDRFDALAKQFKVSGIVVARRARDLELIDWKAFMEFYENRVRVDKKDKPKGGQFYSNQRNRIGYRFGAAVVRAVREGKLLYTDAYSLTDLKRGTFEKYAEAIST